MTRQDSKSNWSGFWGEGQTEEKVVKIVPLKSGYRSSESLEISYTTYYLENHHIKNLMDESAIEVEVDKALEHIAQIEHITIYQREIVSYRKYSSALNDKFYPDTTDIKSKQVS